MIDELQALPDADPPDARAATTRSSADRREVSPTHRTSCTSGRQYTYPVALEGALKLKEISYIHAEGYPAAEMKHGPIALVDENTPVVFIAPRGAVHSKIMSNIEEVKARGGPVIALITRATTRSSGADRRS